MTLGTCFVELEQSAARLQEVFQNLSWAVTQGQPSSRRGPAIVDHWEATAQDVFDLAQRAYEAARVGRVAANGRLDSATARRALSGCQMAFDELRRKYSIDIEAFDRRTALHELLQLSTSWSDWAEGIIDAIAQVPQAIYDLTRTLAVCWEEMVDQQTSISVTGTMHDVHIDRHLAHIEKDRLDVGGTCDTAVEANQVTELDLGF